jgi:hypothetical protein
MTLQCLLAAQRLLAHTPDMAAILLRNRPEAWLRRQNPPWVDENAVSARARLEADVRGRKARRIVP